MYFHPASSALFAAHSDIRLFFSGTSLPSELTDSFLESIGLYPVEKTGPAYNPVTHVAVELLPKQVAGKWTQQWRIDELPQEQAAQNLTRARAAAWEAIKVERDRRAGLGVKVGQHWFHSDQKSRTQQLGLVLLGANIPAGLQWKTLTLTPPPVFVPMTQQLAQAIVSATAASDTAIFTAAEVHRIAVESSTAPQNYDFSTGWPTSIEEEANAAGITFDQSLL